VKGKHFFIKHRAFWSIRSLYRYKDIWCLFICFFVCLVLFCLFVVIAGGADPKTNPRLSLLLQRAKSLNFPKEKIEAAIQSVRKHLRWSFWQNATFQSNKMCEC
jgi:hypothetical protein